MMTITYYPEVTQGSDEWHDIRRGVITASSMKLLLTPTLKIAHNEKVRSHAWELLAQRITNYTEPQFIGDHMLRGQIDELTARDLYSKTYAPVTQMGFIINDQWGFVIGCSPDGLVGDDGMIECKSRLQKFQVETIATMTMDPDFMLQVQASLLVTQRKWCDFVSYCGGLPMVTIRVYPDAIVHNAIVEASVIFENLITEKMTLYNDTLKSQARLIPTERRIEQEMFIP